MNGWVFIDKPKNLTSAQVVRKIKKILNVKKVGHSGTLDPFATGILGIAIGEATKSLYYFRGSKKYSFNVIFGEAKNTDDVTGKTIDKCDLIPSKEQIDSCLDKFLGEHSQIPPQYSAVKVNGVRAYKLARSNIEFDIDAKNVFIYSLTCSTTPNKKEFSFDLECSSGTYVRSIARDLGQMLGTHAYVSKLRRTKIGKIEEKDIILLDKFIELVHIGDHFDVMHSIREVLDDIPAVLIGSDLSLKFQNGVCFNYFDHKTNIDYLLIENKVKFLGIGKAVDGNIKPIRVFNL